jgi:SAM-dependent methyltransferase
MLSTLMSDVPDLEVEGAPPFAILQCSRCGTALTDPHPTESTIHRLYEDSPSTDYEFPEAGLSGRLKDAFARKRIRLLAQPLREAPGRILDFGTGAGRYANAASQVFPNAVVTGTDFAPAAPRGSYYDLNQKLRYVQYDALKDSSARFDLILARHVIEHVHDPVQLLSTWLRTLLAPGGSIYIEVPNLHSQTARLLGSKWPLWYVPRHLSHFTRQSLQAAIERAGGTAKIRSCELPMMGNVLAMKLGRSRFDKRFRLLGVLLHPLQMALEARSSEGTCLFAMVRDAGAPALDKT